MLLKSLLNKSVKGLSDPSKHRRRVKRAAKNTQNKRQEVAKEEQEDAKQMSNRDKRMPMNFNKVLRRHPIKKRIEHRNKQIQKHRREKNKASSSNECVSKQLLLF